MGPSHESVFVRPQILLFALGATALVSACTPVRQAAPLHPLDTADRPTPDTSFGAESDSFHLHTPLDTIRAFVPERQDCDGNGVPDAVDIREGTADDLNHNGILDSCEPDTTLPANPNNQSWRALRVERDTSFFWAGFRKRRAEDGGDIIALRYTVPLEGAHVRLEVFDEHRALVATPLNAQQEAGAYESAWNRAGADGRFLPPGLYLLRLTVDSHIYERRVRWAI